MKNNNSKLTFPPSVQFKGEYDIQHDSLLQQNCHSCDDEM